MPTMAVPAAPTKHARRAVSGERAEKIRCMKSMATMSPMPSATSVAQLIVAPCAGSVSCPRSNGPMPSGTVIPKRTPTQISSAAEPITVMTIWMNAV